MTYQRNFRMRPGVLLLVLILTLILSGCVPPGVVWLLAPKSRIDIIVPNGYTGPILIAYHIPGGIVPQKQDNVWIYPVQEDGALLLAGDPPRGVGQYGFFYRADDGALQTIPNGRCLGDAISEEIVVCLSGHYEIFHERELKPTEMFFVGTHEEWQQFGYSFEEFDRLYNKYLDQLAVPEKP